MPIHRVLLSKFPAFFSALLFAIIVSATPSLADIKVGGTGGDLGTWRILADAYNAKHPETAITVLPSLGSGGGIKALTAGAIDIAISSRPLKEKESAAGLMAVPYAKTALVVSSANNGSLSNLTSDDLVEIFGTGTRNWPNGDPVLVILRPKNDGDAKLVIENIPELAGAFEAAEARGARIAASDQDAADALEETKPAIGFMSQSLILGEGRKLQAYALNGVEPSLQNVADDSYPLLKLYYLVFKEPVSSEHSRLIDFLYSPEGEEILRNTGHVAVGLN